VEGQSCGKCKHWSAEVTTDIASGESGGIVLDPERTGICRGGPPSVIAVVTYKGLPIPTGVLLQPQPDIQAQTVWPALKANDPGCAVFKPREG